MLCLLNSAWLFKLCCLKNELLSNVGLKRIMVALCDFIRFITPLMLFWRKLLELHFIVKRHTPITQDAPEDVLKYLAIVTYGLQ